jgi:hypothetical protein
MLSSLALAPASPTHQGCSICGNSALSWQMSSRMPIPYYANMESGSPWIKAFMLKIKIASPLLPWSMSTTQCLSQLKTNWAPCLDRPQQFDRKHPFFFGLIQIPSEGVHCMGATLYACFETSAKLGYSICLLGFSTCHNE